MLTSGQWNVDPKRWHSSMVYNAKLILNVLLGEQHPAGNWQISSSLADLMFCEPLQLRKNALSLFEIPFYSPSSIRGERHKNSNASHGDVMINYMCTASAIYHLNYILETLINDVRKSMVKATQEAITKGLKWMKKCGVSQNYGGPSRVFSWVSRNQQHWPSIRDDDHNCVIHVRMIQSIGFSSVNQSFCTKISCVTPIQSILMFLNCHFDVPYHYLQAHSSCEIVVRDRNQNYIVFDQLNQTANQMLSSVLNEQQQGIHPVEIEIVFRTVGNQKYPRFRECIPTQIAIEGIEDRHIVQNVQIAIPQGATLYHLRQIISDEMSNSSNNTNGYSGSVHHYNNGNNTGSLSLLVAAKERKRSAVDMQMDEEERRAKLEAEEERHCTYLQKKSEERLDEIRAEYGTTRVEVIMKRAARLFSGSALEWAKSSDYSAAQDKAMRLEIDLKEVENFLDNSPFVPSEVNNSDSNRESSSEEEDMDYNTNTNDRVGEGETKRKKGYHQHHTLGREELATLTTTGPSNNPSNTHKSFCFVHRGLYILPDEEAGILAYDSAVQTGSMGMTNTMEQHSRLLILLQPATDIDLGIDDDEEEEDEGGKKLNNLGRRMR